MCYNIGNETEIRKGSKVSLKPQFERQGKKYDYKD